MLTIRDTSTVPPETWQYTVNLGEDRGSHVVSSRSYNQLFVLVTDFCRANNLPVPSQQEIIDQMCERLHVPCVQTSESGNTALINKMGLPFVPPASGCCKGAAPLPPPA